MLPAEARGLEERPDGCALLRLTLLRLTPCEFTCFVLKSSTDGVARYGAYGVTKVRQMLRPNVAADK